GPRLARPRREYKNGVSRLRRNARGFPLLRGPSWGVRGPPPPWAGFLPTSLCDRAYRRNPRRCTTCLRRRCDDAQRGPRGRAAGAGQERYGRFATIAQPAQRAFLRHAEHQTAEETCADRDPGAAREPPLPLDGQDL